jgi:hypothetical protein
MGRQAKPRNPKMSTFNFSDITPAGAYINATKIARESDRQNAKHHFETNERRNLLRSLWALVQRITTAITEKRLVSTQATSRQV